LRRNDAFNPLEGGDRISVGPDQARRQCHLTNRWRAGRFALRPAILFGLAALACLSPTARLQANLIPIGTQGFVDLGTTASDTGNILTATAFSISNWISVGSQSGIFVGMPIEFLGPQTFDVNVPSTISFHDPVFGAFSATSLFNVTPGPNSIVYSYNGDWLPGAQGGLTGGPFPAALNLAFLQIGGPSTAISTSGTVTVSVEETVIAEPSSFFLSLTGVAAGIVLYLRRRWRDLQAGPAVTV